MKPLVVLQCACFVALVGLLVTQLAAPRAEPMLQQELQALRNDLRDLLAAVARAATPPTASPLGMREVTAPSAADSPHAATTRTPVPGPMDTRAEGGGHPDLLPRVEALETAIRRLHLSAGAGGSANAVAEAAVRRPVADWVALERVRERLQQDHGATRSSLLLLTPAQLVEAFGRPTEMYHHQERTVWTYQRGEHSVSFTVVDGLVIDVSRSQ